MTKYTIPTILIAAALVAGMFAFIPVENASAVHTTIQGTQFNNVDSFFTTALEGAVNASCASDFIVYYILGALDNNDVVTIDLGDTGAADMTLTFQNDADGGQTQISGQIAEDGGDTVEFDLTVGAGADALITVECESGDLITLAAD